MALALALDIISDYHGPVVYIVAQTLSLHGALTLGELQRKIRERSSSTIATVTDIDFFHDRSDLEKTTTLSPESVQSALVILIRYAIVHMRLKSTTGNDNTAVKDCVRVRVSFRVLQVSLSYRSSII